VTAIRVLCAAALVLSGTVGCAVASGQQPAVAGNGNYPGSSVPPVNPVQTPPTAYKRVPSACAVVGAATLRAIAPGVGDAGEEVHANGGVVEHICSWGQASGPGWNRSLMVIIDLETSGSPVDAANAYETELPGIGSSQMIRGLGDRASLNVQPLRTWSSAQLHVLTRNVVITVQYTGEDVGGVMSSSEMKNATVAAARSILAAIH
jgi:hypothetical protein